MAARTRGRSRKPAKKKAESALTTPSAPVANTPAPATPGPVAPMSRGVGSRLLGRRRGTDVDPQQAREQVQAVLKLSWLGEAPAVSRPGGPSAHPERPGVPAPPGLAEQLVGGTMMGRHPTRLEQFRPPPVSKGGAEVDMCAGCDVDCCSGHYIPINAWDAWRMRSVLNLPFREFVGFAVHDKTVPAHPVRLDAGLFCMILKRRPDRGCGFLVRVGSERRCGVHALRPDACRIFPFVPDLETQQKTPGDEMVQIHPSHCPWRWPSTPEHKARVLQDIRDHAEHRVFDREVMSAWFWAVGVERTPENFYQFLEDELPRRVLHPDQPSRYLTALW